MGYAAPAEIFPEQMEASNHSSKLSAEATEKIDSGLADMVGEEVSDGPGVTAIIYKDGKEVYRGSYGQSQIAANKPMLVSTPMRAASISKMFTALGIMQQAEQGNIDLDADISDYLGYKFRNPNFPLKKITPRMLLSHTSSLRDNGYSKMPDMENMAEYLEQDEVFAKDKQKAPGKYFSYSNANFMFLAAALENVSGERFDIYMKNHVLAPLEIKGSFNLADFTPAERKKIATEYRLNDENGYHATVDAQPIKLNYQDRLNNYVLGSNPSIFGPQGGLRVSTEDLAHLLEMFINKGSYNGQQIVSAKTLAEMTKPAWIYDAKKATALWTRTPFPPMALAFAFIPVTLMKDL